ncbi:MAG TPA: S41 family peptidase [Thermoanaerobaculia bacterium]|nr:S41 family peptidase [Thermoanaerobaculia bacterium]
MNRPAVLVLTLLAMVCSASAAAPAPDPALGSFAAVGREIVEMVRNEFYDPKRAAAWAEANDRYAAEIRDAETFLRETRRRLAELRASHTEHYTPDTPGYHDLLAIFEPVLQKSPDTESLGAATTERDGAWFVVRVFAGGPAEAAGLQRGDRLVTADGEPFHPIGLLRGKAGKPVVLGVQSRRDGAVRSVTVTPRMINPKQEWLEAQKAGTRILDHQGRRIAYAPLWSCAGEEHQNLLAEALFGDLKEAEALVLDLRGGWGGCNPQFVNLFNPAVPHLLRIDQGGHRFLAALSWRKPLVVLIDGGSRSGKEVVSRAIQRHRLGTLVGERTAGAVLAGKINLLSDGSVLFLAVHDILADGERLEGIGVTPDVPVSSDLPYAEGRDPQLERALSIAAGR